MNTQSPIKNTNLTLNPISQLFEATKAVFNKATNVAIVAIVLPLVLSLLNFMFQIISELIYPSNTANPTTSQVVYSLTSSIVFMLLSIAIQILIAGLAIVAGVYANQNKTVTVGEAVGMIGRKLWRFIGVNLLIFIFALPWMIGITVVLVAGIIAIAQNPSIAALLVPLGTALLVVGIIAIFRVYLRYSLAAIHLFATNDGVMAALSTSKNITKHRLIEPFGIASIGSVVPIIGTLISPAGLARYYFERRHVNESHLPKPHWLNYLMLILFGVLLLAIGLFVGLIVLLVNANN